ncbi:MAG: hypothetical protein OEN23_01055 [Paracoccaceae bacterium]|nr:hypothetical protein [Paracoccaceae bacterium]
MRGLVLRLFLVAALGLGLAANHAWAQGRVATCDFSGFDKPCAVQGGVYRAIVPEGDGPFPAMVYLYGSGGHSATIANHPVFAASIVERGYALIVPAARKMEYRPGTVMTGWNLRHEPDGKRDDPGFVARVIDDASRRFRLDRDRILLAGQSRGGFLVWEIACHGPRIAAGYAIHAGGYLGPMPRTCAEPVRILHSHGLEDDVVPYSGAPLVSGGVAMARIESSMATMARTNDCAGGPVEAEPMLGLVRTQWTGCLTGSSLDLLLHDGGHTMPVEWFRAVIDWFEEIPEARPEITPVKVGLGTRSEGRFKAAPETGRLLGGSAAPGGTKRLRPPKKNASK